MNTPESKPQSRIAALAASIAPPYRKAMAAFNLSVPWGDMQEISRECTITALTAAITEAVEDTAPMRMPTKIHLRSFLSPYVDYDDNGKVVAIDVVGFDELYNEVKETLTFRTIRSMTGYDKLFNESLEKDALIDNQAERIAVLEDQLGRSIELSKKRSARVNDLLKQNDALEKKNEELVGLGPKHHWDDVVETDGDAMRRMSLPRSSPTADHGLADCIRVRDSIAMQLHESDSKRNGLERTLGTTTNERDEFKHLWEQEVQNSSDLYAMAQELAKVNATHIDMANSVSAILKEFKIECPTNSILDMVRSACEAVKVERELVKSQLDRQDKELQSKRFGSVVEEVIAFRRQHDWMDAGTVGQIVAHILNRDNSPNDVMVPPSPVEHCNVPPDGWECTRARGHTGPCAAVPERQYAGGVPRIDKVDGRVIDHVIGGTLLAGGGGTGLFMGAKYMGSFQ